VTLKHESLPDASIVNVALPSIRRDLGFTPTGLAWVVNGYLLTFAGFMMSLTATRTGRRESLDLTGAVTGTAGLAALIYGVMQSAGHGWASAQVLRPAGAGLLLLVVFTVVEAHFATQPMMPPRLLRIPAP